MVDELHLLLRITDVLERNLVLEMVEWDAVEGASPLSSGKHLNNLLKVISSLGVSFAVWQSKKQGKDFEFTSLMGPDKVVVLEKLPEKFPDLLHPETCGEVKWLWEEFSFAWVFSWLVTKTTADQWFQRRAKLWVERFYTLGDRRAGYQKERVTLYMHMLPYHVPHQLRSFSSLKQFSCTPIEKRNDYGRRVFQLKSNRKDPLTDVLQSQERLVLLASFERTRRQYDMLQRNPAGSAEGAEVTDLLPSPVYDPFLTLPAPMFCVGASAQRGTRTATEPGGQKRPQTCDNASTSKRVCAEMVSSPEDVMQLNKKDVCDQLRLRGLAAPTRLTVSELREQLVKFLNCPTVA